MTVQYCSHVPYFDLFLFHRLLRLLRHASSPDDDRDDVTDTSVYVNDRLCRDMSASKHVIKVTRDT